MSRIFFQAAAFALTAALPIAPAFGQQWSAQLSILPFPSPYVSDWESNPGIATLTVDYLGDTPAQVQFHLTVVGDRNGEIASGDSDPIDFAPNTVGRTFDTPHLVDWNNLSYPGDLEDRARRTGRLPEDHYRACIEIRENGVSREEACAEFDIVWADPPSLLAPDDGVDVWEQFPQFAWMPVTAPLFYTITYHLRVVELLEGQTPARALEANIPHFEGDVPGETNLRYPEDARPFEEGHTYVWQVQALDQFGVPLATNEGKSEIFTFTFSLPALQSLMVVVLPARIAVSPADTDHEITFMFTLSGREGFAGEGVTLTSYQVTWADEDVNRMYHETSSEIFLSERDRIYIPPGDEGSEWTYRDNYDDRLREILLAGREQASYRKIFTFYGHDTRGIPIRPITAPHYMVNLLAPAFTVTATPAMLEYNPEVTRRELNFELRGSSAADIRVTRNAATWRLADGSSQDIEPTEMNLLIPRGGIENWSTGQSFPISLQCETLNRLGVNETEVEVIYQFDGVFQLEGGELESVSATAAFIMRVSRPEGRNTFTASASPATLEFSPAVTRQSITFRFQAPCEGSVQVTRNVATWQLADGSRQDIEPTEMNLSIPQSGTEYWPMNQPVSRELQCDILDRLGVDETDVTVTYEFDGELRRQGERPEATSAMAAFLMHITRPEGAGTFAVTANPQTVEVSPGVTEQQINFLLEAPCSAAVEVSQMTATAEYADGSRVDLGTSQVGVLVRRAETADWPYLQVVSAELQAGILEHLGADETDVAVMCQFDGELQLGNGRTQRTSAMAAFSIHISRAAGGRFLALTATPDQPLRFYPGVTSIGVTYLAELLASAPAGIWFDALEYKWLEGGSTLEGPVPEPLNTTVPIAVGDHAVVNHDITISEEKLTEWLDGRRQRTLTLQVAVEALMGDEIVGEEGEAEAERIRSTPVELTVSLFASAEDAAQADLLVLAIPDDVSYYPGITSHEITYNLDLYASAQAGVTLTTSIVTYRDQDGTVYKGPISTPLPRPIELDIDERTTTEADLTVSDEDRTAMLSNDRDSRLLTATVEFTGTSRLGRDIRVEANPITLHVFRTAEAAGASDYVLLEDVALIRTTDATTVTESGENRILNGTATLIIIPEPFDRMQVNVNLDNLTFAPGSELQVTSGSLYAESPPDGVLFSLYAGLLKITHISYNHDRAREQRFLADAAYVMILGSRVDLTNVIINRDGLSLRNASLEHSMFGLTFRFTDMSSGMDGDRKMLSFTVHTRLKGKRQSEEFASSALKLFDDGGVQGHFTPTPPLRLIPNTDYLNFKDFEWKEEDDEWFMKVTAEVNYPGMFKNLGPTEVSFKIDQDQHIVGEIAPIRETTPSVAGDRSMVGLGEVAVLDLTYLGLQLSLVDGEIDEDHSRIGLACDFYFELVGGGSDTVRVGDADNPGVIIDFTGNVDWQAITVGPDKKFKFGPVYIKIASFTINPEPSAEKPYYVELSGGLGIDLTSVDGEIDFEAMRIDTTGDFDMASTVIRGGDLTIVNALGIGLDDFSYSDDPTTLTFKERRGNESRDISIETESHFRLEGARLSIGSSGDGGSGGFKDLLVYTREGQTNFLLREAKIDIADVEITMDCKYVQDDPSLGTILAIAGSAKTPKFTGTVVGKIGETADHRDTYGLFLAVSGLSIPIGPITLDELGGGFFYNPIEEDLAVVRAACGIDRPELRDSITRQRPRGAGDPGSFAALIYAGAYVSSKDVLDGRALMTITENSLSLDMEVDVLKKAGHGAAYMIFGWDPSYAEGRISFELDYHSVITADAEVDFYAYTSDVWGINGTSEVKILVFAGSEATFFVGPPGFMLDTETSMGFDVGVLKAEAGFETMVWWQVDVSWGAYARVWAEAEILWGLVGVSGSMEGALIGDPGLLYCVGSFRAEVCWVEVFNGSIWVSVGLNGFDGGTGRNARYDQMIADAKHMGEEMEVGMHELASALDDARNAMAELSEEQRRRAGQRLLETATGRFIVSLAYSTDLDTDSPANLRWVYDNNLNAQAVRDIRERKSELENQAGEDGAIADAISALEDRQTDVQDNLRGYSEFLTGELPTLSDLTTFGNPIGAKQFQSIAVGDRMLTVQTGYEFDAARASEMKSSLHEAQQDYAAYQQQLFTMVDQFKQSLEQVDDLLYSGGSSLSGLTADYTRCFDQINDYYAELMDYLNDSQRTAREKKGALENRRDGIVADLTDQKDRLPLSQVRNLTALRRSIIAWLTPNWNQANPTTEQEWRNKCLEWGQEVWYEIPRGGYQAIIDGTTAARQTVADAMDESVGSFVGRWYNYTHTLDGVYERKAALHELLFGLYDQLSLTASDFPPGETAVVEIAGPQIGGGPGMGGTPSRIPGRDTRGTPREYFGRLRDAVGQSLEVPQIDSFTGTATSSDIGYATVTLNWSATHPVGVAEYTFRFTKPPRGGGQIYFREGAYIPPNRSVGTLGGTHLTLVDGAFGEGSYSIRLRARGAGGYIIERLGTVDVQYLDEGQRGPITDGLDASDRTAPTVPVVTDDGEFTASSSVLHATWQASDAQSGIQEYQYAVGRQVTIRDPAPRARKGATINILDATGVVDWTSAGGMTELNIRDLALQHGTTYYISVKAKNGVGMWSQVGRSNGIQVDTTPPSAPRIGYFRQPSRFDVGAGRGAIPGANVGGGIGGGIGGGQSAGGGGRGQAEAAPPNTLSAAWAASSDAESRISEYRYAIGTTVGGNDIVDWTSTDDWLFQVESLPLENGRTYYLTVKAYNGVGVPSESDTSSVAVEFSDNTPPPSAPNISAPTYDAGNHTLRASWSLGDSDPESGILRYEYQVTSTVKGLERPLFAWTSTGVLQEFTRDLTLKKMQPYTLKVRVINGVGLSTTGTRDFRP